MIIGLFFAGSYLLEAKLRTKQSYFQEYAATHHEIHLPQGFYAQKAVVMLEERIQKLPWMETWRALSAIPMPPVHQVSFEGAEGKWVTHVTVEAQDDATPLLEALKEGLHADTAALTQIPAFMDESRPFAMTMTEGGPALMTLTLTKGL